MTLGYLISEPESIVALVLLFDKSSLVASTVVLEAVSADKFVAKSESAVVREEVSADKLAVKVLSAVVREEVSAFKFAVRLLSAVVREAVSAAKFVEFAPAFEST